MHLGLSCGYLLTYRFDGSIAHVWIRVRRVGSFAIDGSIELLSSITRDCRIQYPAISPRARDGDEVAIPPLPNVCSLVCCRRQSIYGAFDYLVPRIRAELFCVDIEERTKIKLAVCLLKRKGVL